MSDISTEAAVRAMTPQSFTQQMQESARERFMQKGSYSGEINSGNCGAKFYIAKDVDTLIANTITQTLQKIEGAECMKKKEVNHLHHNSTEEYEEQSNEFKGHNNHIEETVTFINTLKQQEHENT